MFVRRIHVTTHKAIKRVVTKPSSQQPSLSEKRLKEVLTPLYEALIKRKGIFSEVTIQGDGPQHKYYPGYQQKETPSPQEDLFEQNNHPKIDEEDHSLSFERGSLLHLRWLWFATLTDRREVSDRVYEAHTEIFRNHPHFYEKEVCLVSDKVFRDTILGNYKIGAPKDSVVFWKICAETLFTRFDGDPAALLKEAGWSVDAVYAWKQKEKKRLGYDPIPGWGRKLLSLYFLYLSELGYPLPDDAFASDVHAQALILQTGVFSFGELRFINSLTLAERLRKSITKLAKNKGFDVITLAHASWLLGSKLCVRCSKTKEVELLCPVYHLCKGRIDTKAYTRQGRWYKEERHQSRGGEMPPYGIPTDPKHQKPDNRKQVIEITSLFSK
jgi:hypothetical protein